MTILVLNPLIMITFQRVPLHAVELTSLAFFNKINYPFITPPLQAGDTTPRYDGATVDISSDWGSGVKIIQAGGGVNCVAMNGRGLAMQFSLRPEKDRYNIDIYRGFIEKFGLFQTELCPSFNESWSSCRDGRIVEERFCCYTCWCFFLRFPLVLWF